MRDVHAPGHTLRTCLTGLLLLLLGLFLCVGAQAQGIESVLAPGKLTQSHAKAEADCKNCHVKFDRNAQDRLCGDCHKDIAADVRDKAGFHGRKLATQPAACRDCHTDHKGRGARIVELDTKAFDHAALADWALRGAHVKTECKSCHVAGKRWAEAPQDCVACHRKDDVHDGSFGNRCEQCHVVDKWSRIVNRSLGPPPATTPKPDRNNRSPS